MKDFDLQVLERLPLMDSVLTLLRYAWDEEALGDLFEQHRGTGSEVKVSFAQVVEVVSDAIVEHQGSGRQSFQRAREDGRLDATDGAVYGKLRRMPVRLSEALLLETTRRLQELLPSCTDDSAIPPALRCYRVLVVDGKKLKKLPKRLKPLREVSGKVLGGMVVVGMFLNDGLAIAMHASPDGDANDAPLTPGLLKQLDGRFTEPMLVVADRQYCDLKVPHQLVDGGYDFVIRYSKKMLFFPENEQCLQDSQGRVIRDSRGVLGSEKDPRRMALRQITLERPGEEDVTVVTTLLDSDAVPAQQVLDVYLQRWSIERLFQKVTEVFHLQQLIGTSPQGAIFQFALCTCLYNVIQLVRQYLASLNERPAESLSSELIFRDVCKEFIAGTQFSTKSQLAAYLQDAPNAEKVRDHLNTILANRRTAAWQKSPPKKTGPPKPKKHVPGGHSSAHKLLQQAKPPPS